MRLLILFLFIFSFNTSSFSQCTFTSHWKENYPATFPTYIGALTPQIDVTGKPYVYVASNEFGLRTYKINGTSPVLIASLDTNDLSMRAMSVSQYDTILYIAVGSTFSTVDPPGVVAVSVADPENPIVLDTWIHSSNGSGCGIVKKEGDFLYVGGMTLGLFILNVSNPANMQFVSHLPLNINWPVNNPANPLLYNLRGMEVKNSIVYGCFDAGGIRIINCTNPNSPIETGRFANPITYPPVSIWNLPRAYNNIIVNDTIAYVAVDYCGVEILNIKDTSNITMVTHYNPHDCPLNGQWTNAPIHANEMKYIDECNKLFVSTGKSKMIVLDVADPFNVDSCGGYGVLNDTSATWGIDMRNDTIILTHCVGFGLPFSALHPGVEMITWNEGCPLSVEEKEKKKFKIYPNPSVLSSYFTLSTDQLYIGGKISIYDLTGKCVYETTIKGGGDILIYNSLFSESIYNVVLQFKDEIYSEKMVITR